MSEIEIQKLDRKTKEQARLYYFADYSIGDISSILGVDTDTLRFYIFGDNGSGSNEGCWFQLKKQLGPASVAAFVHDKIGVLEKTSGVALNLLNENLKRIEQKLKDNPDEVLTIDDTKKLAAIVVDMDKIIRLESGQATQIVENIGLSRAEAVRLLKDDPFAQDIEVDESEYTYVSESSNEIVGNVGVETPWKK